jgi:hypothetical protein
VTSFYFLLFSLSLNHGIYKLNLTCLLRSVRGFLQSSEPGGCIAIGLEQFLLMSCSLFAFFFMIRKW